MRFLGGGFVDYTRGMYGAKSKGSAAEREFEAIGLSRCFFPVRGDMSKLFFHGNESLNDPHAKAFVPP